LRAKNDPEIGEEKSAISTLVDIKFKSLSPLPSHRIFQQQLQLVVTARQFRLLDMDPLRRYFRYRE